MKQPVVIGIVAGVGLLTLYASIMTSLSGWQAAIAQFQSLWFLYVPLAAGFGIQLGLYTKLKQVIQQKTRATLATGGTSAGIGMLACCAHHATDVLPILGLSAAAALIARYQTPLLLGSLFINLIGIAIIWRHLTKVL